LLLAPAAQAQRPAPLTPETVIAEIPLAPGQRPLQVTLSQMMTLYKVPGFSVAVVARNRIAWAAGFGVRAPSDKSAVTPHTLFQAASISKPVTAAGNLWLVEHDQLALDENVNGELASWKVPDNEFTIAEKVTLRRLLSHNAGTNVSGFDGYARGMTLPTTEQTLNGLAPANNPPVRVTATPGTQCNYSGGGFTIAGQLIRDVSGQSFEEFMRQHVLLPAGMTESTFQQQLPPALAALAATGTHRDGLAIAGQWRLYPELAPDGLWTTPTDLAKFAIEIALSAHGKANHILSQSTVREMLTVQCHDDPNGPGGTGLGLALGYQHDPAIFFHNGSNDGFKSILMMEADSGWGYAAMSNSDNFDVINRRVMQTIAKHDKWNIDPTPQTRDLGEELTLIQSFRGLHAALDSYHRAKASGFAGLRHDANTLNNLGYRMLGENRTAESVRIFELNVAEYPDDANTYDSLAEAYVGVGKRDLAIQNYERSLALNPKNENAANQLKKLRAR
jgi:CubicO group peptidase (beta-lactamase class C family)